MGELNTGHGGEDFKITRPEAGEVEPEPNPTDAERIRIKEFNVEIPETATFRDITDTVEFYEGPEAAHDTEIMVDRFLDYAIDQLGLEESLDQLKAMKMSEFVAAHPEELSLAMIEHWLPVIFD